ncbi:hypothetical protein H7K45_15865 [Mycobacterium yunnanensis]|uniref:Uncharacterized protein n=2 Tax=Mycobacterium yunnanensis TaxID=368477 RepID=A0A9X2Z589_9MYCO|nr:hypothetical protein [Mycobacterium yunnanensis]
MGPVFDRYGFVSDGVSSELEYGELPAWALFYVRDDCKLQVCWSAREGGVDFMLAPVNAPNELGLRNDAKSWQYLLLLSDFDEGLTTPSLDAPTEEWWEWRKALFEAHFPAAHAALLAR